MTLRLGTRATLPSAPTRAQPARLAARWRALRCTSAALQARQGSRQIRAGCQSSAREERPSAATAPSPSSPAAKIQRLPASTGLAASGEDDTPEGEHRGALRRHRLRVELGRLLVEAGPVLGPAQGFAVGIGGGEADALGQQPGGLGAAEQGDVADVVGPDSGCAPLSASTSAWTANSTSIIPPGLCFRSKRPSLTGCAARTFSRIAFTSPIKAARSRGAARTWRRTTSKRGASRSMPAHQRARLSATVLPVQAVLPPRPDW